MNDMPTKKQGTQLSANLIAVRIPKTKNKTAADIQITSEQLIREALANQTDDLKPPRARFTDEEELVEYQLRKRMEFENEVKKQKYHIHSWIKYATWEFQCGKFDRGRSVFERALKVDYKNPTLWLRYLECEMINKNVQSARNIFERACKLFPRIDQFWYKYAYMEEILRNYNGAKAIFERWMEISPELSGWLAYAKFWKRMKDIPKVIAVLERCVKALKSPQAYIQSAKILEKQDPSVARQFFEQCLNQLGQAAYREDFFMHWAKFELRLNEQERARTILQFGLQHVNKPSLGNLFVKLEKQYGEIENLETVVINKRRALYDNQLKDEPYNYETWIDFIRLEESQQNWERYDELCERAISQIPLMKEKKYWKRYVFIWIHYAIIQELRENFDKARQIYSTLNLQIIPQSIPFAKTWMLWGLFEIRMLQIEKAREIFVTGIEVTQGKPQLFKAFIQLEQQLGEIQLCREQYKLWLSKDQNNPDPWLEFINFEIEMEEFDRARKLLQISLDQQNLQRPELLWKKAIDFEIQLGQQENARNLYEQLLKKAQHVKIWISYASFEEQSNEILNARLIFQRGDDYLKQSDEREARALLLEKWNEFELKQGANGIDIKSKLPTRIKKKRKLGEGGWEEYVDYIFPDEQVQNKNLSLKNAAHQWKLKFQQTKQETLQENVVQVNTLENQDVNQQSEETKEQNEEAKEQNKEIS